MAELGSPLPLICGSIHPGPPQQAGAPRKRTSSSWSSLAGCGVVLCQAGLLGGSRTSSPPVGASSEVHPTAPPGPALKPHSSHPSGSCNPSECAEARYLPPPAPGCVKPASILPPRHHPSRSRPPRRWSFVCWDRKQTQPCLLTFRLFFLYTPPQAPRKNLR